MNSLLSNHIALLFITACGAGIIAYFTIPVVINVSRLKKLLDEPGHRKLHKVSTPNLGGVALFMAIILGFLLSGYAAVSWGPYLLAALIILFFSGLKDDILVISALKKLLLQCVAIFILIIGSGIRITEFGGIFGIYHISYGLSLVVTFCTMVVVLNAYNLIDGLDGLCGGVGLIAALFFGYWFYDTGMMADAVLAFALAGSLAGFLFYNFEPAQIFMGDTGSQVIGLILAFLAVNFVESATTATTTVLFQQSAPVLIVAVLIVPLYDTLRVFLVRAIKGHSPFTADRRHVHHQLIDCGFSHGASCLIIYGFNLSIIALAITLADMNVNILLAVVIISAIVLFPTARFKRRLLARLGFSLPSADHIRDLEERMTFMSKSVGTAKQNDEHEKGGKITEKFAS